MKLINDWKPETKSLLKSLAQAGFSVVSADNGEGDSFKPGDFKTEGAFLDELLACDEAALVVKHQAPDSKKKSIWLVLGNSPGELVSDYTVDPLLDKVTDEHYNKWSGRKQPQIESTY